MNKTTKQPKENEVCDCFQCGLIEEFRNLIEADTDWESALRHVLYVATSKDDEIISEILDDVSNEAYEDGFLAATQEFQKFTDAYIDEVTDKVYEVRDRRENPEDYADEDVNKSNVNEKLDDLSDEQYDFIQEKLRGKI